MRFSRFSWGHISIIIGLAIIFLVSMFRRRGTGENTFYENEKITSYAVKYETMKTDEKMDKFFQQTMKEGYFGKLDQSNFVYRKRRENLLQQQHIKKYCKSMPPAHRKYSNDKRDLVYISSKKKVAYCKVPKVGTNSWGNFFSRAVLNLKSFEKKMHISINNRTLEQLRAQENFRGWEALSVVMPRLKSFQGKVSWKQYKSLLVIRHPLERMESLYSNKFSKITNLYNVTYKPTSPFKWITKQIVSARKYDPGPGFNTSITPNEFVRFVLNDLKTKKNVNGHWAPIWKLCPVCLLKFTVYARAENISEDEKYYKAITGLDDKTGMKDSIDHGNISPRKFSSKQFWDQVEKENILQIKAPYAYKHDFELFGYSLEEYLQNL